MDRSWMLNPKAIRAAKECIMIVKKELGVKLTLSHPEFMEMLHEYVDLTDSAELGTAYSKLLSMAGVGNVVHNLKPRKVVGSNTAEVLEIAAISPEREVRKVVGADLQHDVDFVEHGGKRYPKWRDGKQFKGIYRGQPTYV